MNAADTSHYVAERKRNLFVNKAGWARVLSASQEPFFRIRPPRGYGVLEMTGRKTGKKRCKCVRAIRDGDKAYLVSIRPTAWLANVRANPRVRLRIRGGTFPGVVRELRPDEVERARAAYCQSVSPFEFAECMMWRTGRPTRAKMKELHADWFAQGTPLVIDLEQDL
jgi:deazaflavin-dependent oxidoreductase (nitroreductase family)